MQRFATRGFGHVEGGGELRQGATSGGVVISRLDRPSDQGLLLFGEQLIRFDIGL